MASSHGRRSLIDHLFAILLPTMHRTFGTSVPLHLLWCDLHRLMSTRNARFPPSGDALQNLRHRLQRRKIRYMEIRLAGCQMPVKKELDVEFQHPEYFLVTKSFGVHRAWAFRWNHELYA